MKSAALDQRLLAATARATQLLSERAAQGLVRKPLFHGTRRATLIKGTGFKASTGGEFGPGLYFTDFQPTAEFYALRVATGPEKPSVIQCRVSVERPFVVTKTDWIILTSRKTPLTVQRRIVDLGYDGIVGLGLTGQPQIVVFSPEQVKFVSVSQIE